MALKQQRERRLAKPIRMLLPRVSDIKQASQEERRENSECARSLAERFRQMPRACPIGFYASSGFVKSTTGRWWIIQSCHYPDFCE
jgi:hypothetical protein